MRLASRKEGFRFRNSTNFRAGGKLINQINHCEERDEITAFAIQQTFVQAENLLIK